MFYKVYSITLTPSLIPINTSSEVFAKYSARFNPRAGYNIDQFSLALRRYSMSYTKLYISDSLLQIGFNMSYFTAYDFFDPLP